MINPNEISRIITEDPNLFEDFDETANVRTVAFKAAQQLSDCLNYDEHLPDKKLAWKLTVLLQEFMRSLESN